MGGDLTRLWSTTTGCAGHPGAPRGRAPARRCRAGPGPGAPGAQAEQAQPRGWRGIPPGPAGRGTGPGGACRRPRDRGRRAHGGTGVLRAAPGRGPMGCPGAAGAVRPGACRAHAHLRQGAAMPGPGWGRHPTQAPRGRRPHQARRGARRRGRRRSLSPSPRAPNCPSAASRATLCRSPPRARAEPPPIAPKAGAPPRMCPRQLRHPPFNMPLAPQGQPV